MSRLSVNNKGDRDDAGDCVHTSWHLPQLGDPLIKVMRPVVALYGVHCLQMSVGSLSTSEKEMEGKITDGGGAEIEDRERSSNLNHTVSLNGVMASKRNV